MADQQVVTTMGTSLEASVLKESTLQAFKARLRGALLRPGEAGYDDARTIWWAFSNWAMPRTVFTMMLLPSVTVRRGMS